MYEFLAPQFGDQMPPKEEFYGYFDTPEGRKAVHDNIVQVSLLKHVSAPSFVDMEMSTLLPEKLRKQHGLPTKYSAGVVPEFLYDRNPDTGKPARIFIDEAGVTALGDRASLGPNPSVQKEVDALRNQMVNTHLMNLLAQQTSIATEDPRLAGLRSLIGGQTPEMITLQDGSQVPTPQSQRIEGDRLADIGALGAPIPGNPFFILKSMNDGMMAGYKEFSRMNEDVRAGRIAEDSAQYKIRGLAAISKIGMSAALPASLTLQVFSSGMKLLEGIPDPDFQNIMKFVMAPGVSLAEKYAKLSDEEKKSVGDYGVDPTWLAVGELVDFTYQLLVAKGAHKVAGGGVYTAARYRAYKEGRLNLTPEESRYYGENEMTQLHRVLDRVTRDEWHFRFEKPGVLAYGPGDATSYIEVRAPKDAEGAKAKTAYFVTRPDGSTVLVNTLGEAKRVAHSYYVDKGYLELDRFKPITTFEAPGTMLESGLLSDNGANPISSKRIDKDQAVDVQPRVMTSPEFDTLPTTLSDIGTVTHKGSTRTLTPSDKKISFTSDGVFERGKSPVVVGDIVTVKGKKYTVDSVSGDNFNLRSLEPRKVDKVVTASGEAVERLTSPDQQVDATVSSKVHRLGLSKEFEGTFAGLQPLIKQVSAQVAKAIKDKVLAPGKRHAAIRDGIIKAIQEDPNYKSLPGRVRSQLYAVANSIGRKLVYDVKSAEFLMPDEMKNLQSFRDLTYQAKIQAQLKERLLRSGLTVEQIGDPHQKLAEYVSDSVADVTKSQRLSYFYSKLSVITRKLGHAGAEAVTKLHDADARHRILDNERRVLLSDIRTMKEQMRKAGRTVEFTRISRQVAEALGDQKRAAEILGSSPEAKMFYDKAKQFLDYYRDLLTKEGIEVLDDYFPHMTKMSGMEFALQRKLSGEQHVEDIGIARLYSKIDADAANLLKRRDALREWDMDALDVLDRYASQVNRQLAYTEAIDWLYNRNEGFRSKLAPSLQRRVGVKGRMAEPISGMSELINYYRDSIFRPDKSNWAYDVLQQGNVNFMRSVISYSVKNAMQNRLQVHLARANWSPEANDLFLSTRKSAYKKGLTHELGLSGDIGVDHPNIAKFLEETSRFIPESVDQMIGESIRTELAKRQGILTRAFNKHDWFAASEVNNWKDVLLGNMYDLAMRTPEYAEALKKYGSVGDANSQRLSAINDVLGNKERFERIMQKAGLLTAETQVSTLPSMRAHAYDNKWSRLTLAFTQFRFRQFQTFMEHMPGRQKGSRGADAYNILRRGEEGEVIPVELLREVEIERKAVETALKTDKNLGFDRETVRLYAEFLKGQEKELNGVVHSLARRPSGAQRTIILGRYFASNAAISAAFGALYRFIDEEVNAALSDEDSRIAGDGSGSIAEEEDDTKGGQRFMYNLIRDVSPFPIDVFNPAGTIGIRFLPKDDGRPGFNADELSKTGFNIAPWYVTAPNRLMGGVPQKLTTKVLQDVLGEKKEPAIQ